MDEITIRDQAYPALVIPGDVIAIYAGNPDPSYTAEVNGYPWVAAKPTDDGEPIIMVPTDDGPYPVPERRLIGIVRWATVRGERALAWGAL